MGIYLIKFDGYQGILKCNHNYKQETIEILKSINEFSTNNIKIITIGTSGTIKKLINKHMNKLTIFL
jgi:RNase P/RNase MRP subunit POP5